MTKRPRYQPDNWLPFDMVLCAALVGGLLLLVAYLDGSSIREEQQRLDNTQREVIKP